MTKKDYLRVTFISLLVLLGWLVVVLFTAGPTLIDIIAHRAYGVERNKLSAELETFHKSLFISDMHSDAMLWHRNLLARNNYGHVDIPRMIAGNMAIQFFTSPTKTPFLLNYENNTDKTDMMTALMMMQHNATKTWFSLLERALYHSERLHNYAKQSKNTFYVIHNKKELANYLTNRKRNPHITAGIMGLEGAHALEGKLSNIDVLYNTGGFRMLAPVHFFDNRMGGSAHGVDKGGLTKLGRQFISIANKKNIIIDLSHASKKLISDAIALSTKPMVLSHTGVKASCDNGRNISTRHLKQISERGGLIAIAFFYQASCGHDLDHIVTAITKAIALAGENSIALGSDFDGVVRTPIDVSQMKYLTAALLKKGLSKVVVAKVMGGNVLRFLQENLPER